MLIQRGVSLFIVLYINLFFIQFTNAKEVCKGPGLKITPQDGYIYLSGNLCPGDGEKFVQYISNSSQSYKVVRLNLTGGQASKPSKLAITFGITISPPGLTPKVIFVQAHVTEFLLGVRNGYILTLTIFKLVKILSNIWAWATTIPIQMGIFRQRRVFIVKSLRLILKKCFRPPLMIGCIKPMRATLRAI